MRAPKRVRRLLSLLAGGALTCASILVPITAAHAAAPELVTISPPAPFAITRLGHFRLQELIVTNKGPTSTQIDPGATQVSTGDFLLSPIPAAADPKNCLSQTGNIVAGTPIASGGTCDLYVSFAPAAFGNRSDMVTVGFVGASSVTLTLSGIGVGGYYIAGAASEWVTAGWAPTNLSHPAQALNAPVVGISGTPSGNGFWLDASDGGVFTAGDATFLGSMGGQHLNKPIVGMAATPDGAGYWLVASDGGIFTFGTAKFYGSMGSQHLNKPIVGMAATPDGLGYWLVASDGGIFTFGKAAFKGSTGAVRLNKPVVGMAATPDGLGYWLVATDGGIFAFGTAGFYGSSGNLVLNKPIVGMAPSPTAKGYWLVAADGGIITYGDAPFYGSLGGKGASDIIGMAGGRATVTAGNEGETAPVSAFQL